MIQTGPNHILPGVSSQAPQKKIWKKDLKTGVYIFQIFLPYFLRGPGLARTGKKLVEPAYSRQCVNEGCAQTALQVSGRGLIISWQKKRD
jgi:hypothetical protein